MHVSINLRITKRTLAGFLLVVILCLAGAFFFTKNLDDPLPASIKKQASFKIVYPSKSVATISRSSYNYQQQQQVLAFSTVYQGANVAFSEQPAPSSLGTGSQVYYPALGIHPYAQFKTNLGPVALTKFWQSGNLQPEGQAAVLVSGGTLTIAHTDKSLTNQQWKDLFDNLKIAR